MDTFQHDTDPKLFHVYAGALLIANCADVENALNVALAATLNGPSRTAIVRGPGTHLIVRSNGDIIDPTSGDPM